jgi:hypothetical protein
MRILVDAHIWLVASHNMNPPIGGNNLPCIGNIRIGDPYRALGYQPQKEQCRRIANPGAYRRGLGIA